MTRILVGIAIVALSVTSAVAQTDVRGVVVDAASGEALPGATVLATGPDSTRVGASADADGAFRLALAPGTYALRVSFVGYRAGTRGLVVGAVPVDLGPLPLRPDTTALSETVVEAIETRVTVRGDTTVFNAEAYGTLPDATAGDLLRRLPGVTVRDGTVFVHGEAVERVLVDGREFFGGDVMAALAVLPASVLETIEVFDRPSERARFTGFRDGEESPAINLVLTEASRSSRFGRGQAGAGTGLRYASSGALNAFDGDRRVSAYAQGSNVDGRTLGALEGEDQPGPRVRRFLSGITETLTTGVNVSDVWGDGVEVTASYSRAGFDNRNDTRLVRDVLLDGAAGQRYLQATEATRDAVFHNGYLRLQTDLSERTALDVRSSVEVQAADRAELLDAETVRADGSRLSRSVTASEGAETGLEADLRAELRHRFATDGRTLSAEVRIDTERDDDDGRQRIDTFGADAVDRRVEGLDRERSLRLEVEATERLAEGLQARLSYRHTRTARDDDRLGLRLDARGAVAGLDSSYTAATDQWSPEHRVAVGVQHTRDGLTATVGLRLVHERVAFEQAGPRAFAVDFATTSLDPSARVQAELSERTSLDLNYFAHTQTPPPGQLRDAVDDANPLLLEAGNPDLRPARSHTLNASLRTANPTEGTSLGASLSGTADLDAIGTAAVFAGEAPVVVRGVTVPAGGQLSAPANLGTSLLGSLGVFHGRPVLSGNLALRATLGLSRTPRSVDGVVADVDRLSASGRAQFSATPSERLDVMAQVETAVRSALGGVGPEGGGLDVRHEAGGGVRWLGPAGLALETEARVLYTPALGAGLDPLATIVNLGAGLRFGPEDAVEARLAVVDLLDEGQAATRRVTAAYVEDRQTLALGRFVLVSLAYTIRPPARR